MRLLLLLVACPAGPGDTGGATTTQPESSTPATLDETAVTPTGAESFCGTVSDAQALTTVTVQPSTGVIGRHLVDATLAWPGHVQARCVSDQDPADIHWAESEQPDIAHTLVLAGLLPTHDYSCQVTPVCPSGPAAPQGFALPYSPLALQGLPQPSVTHHAERDMAGAYTLISHFSALGVTGTQIVMLDPEGEPRWSHALGGVGIDTEVQWADGTVFYGGGGFTGTGTVGQVDLAGQAVYSAPPWDTAWDHHVELRDDGTLFGLAGEDTQIGPRLYQGFQLVHWDPATDEVLWEWHSIDAVNRGELPSDDAHANWASLTAFGEDTQATASLCELQQLIGIDLDTGSVAWTLGVDGDFSLVDADGNSLADDDLPQCQHGVDIRDDHWLMVDNGRDREESRALELRLDPETWTATVAWDWTDGWYNEILGDADYLDGDHVLVLNGVANGIGDRPWLAEVHVPTGEVVWQADFNSRDWVYRADRIDGCDVFHAERYCPGVVDGLRGGPVLP